MVTPSDHDLLLWEPSLETKQQANITHYWQWLEQAKGLHFQTREELWQWSVTHLEDFWTSIWDFFHITASQSYKTVLTTHTMPGVSWFPEAKLNYAEHIFRNHSDQRPALLFRSEHHSLREVSWDELRQKVSAVTKALQEMGVQCGDRVIAYMPNIPETIIAFLACASMGAIWSSCSPDFGISSAIDRFQQIEPKVLFAVDGYQYGGQRFDRRHVLAALQKALPSLQKTILVPYIQKQFEPGPLTNTIAWQEMIAQPADLTFEQVPFDHPLWILYSSGTTGLPKAIVQGHGGILLEHLKNLSLEMNLKPGDRFFWFTTTGWMMWNFLVSGLLVEATLLLYDGSPAYPDMNTLWQFAQDTEMTFFGASAAYISSCMKIAIEPGEQFDLHKLLGVGSTGSPLPPEGFQWLYEHVKEDLWLASISGGTDVCSAFVNGSILLPVHSGELQCRSLGAKIEAFDEQGHALIDEVGELVITEPLPSMPLFFWNDPDHQRYRESYFSVYPGIWRHGDWIKITPRGSTIIYGRSDSTINRAGIRIGTSEIYRVVESLSEVLDSLVVGVELPQGRYYMPLFVVLREGVGLDDALKAKINEKLRTAISPYHVPDEILTIPEVPRTLNGKKVEVPIKKLLMGVPIEKSGVPIEWTILCEGERRMKFPLPTYPFERQQFWIDPWLQERSDSGSLLQAEAGEGQPVDWNDRLASITPGSPLHPRASFSAAYVAPTNETERTICAIWQQLLRIESVGIHDSFFELGGHSLLVINFIADLYKAVQIRISMQDVLKAPTVAELAVLIEAMKWNEVRQDLSALSQTSQREGEPNHPISFPMIVPDPSKRNAPYPLTDLQQAYWIGQTDLFELGNIFAHIYLEIEIPHLDLSRLNHAIQCLVERHDALRSIVLSDGQQQVLNTAPHYQIPVTDLRGQDKQEVATQLAATRTRMSQHGPSTYEWPLWEIRASLLDHQYVRLHVSFCLILLDARSQATLIKELVHLYQDPHASLLPLKLTCRDYILALQDLEHTPLYQESYTYWMQRLTTLPPAPELPLLKRPGNIKETRFVSRSRQLDAPTWQRLKALAARQGLTPNAILYTAYAEVLATWSKTAHFTINMLFFNRFPMHPQVDDLVGNLSATLLLEVNLTESSSFVTHAQQLQQQLWNDLAHSSISGVHVIREVAKMQGWTSQALMPVTFSSGLNIGVMPLAESEEQWSVEYHSLQTPQVYLDHWVQEEKSGGLNLWWYTVDEVFPEGMPAEMLDAYYHLLQSLANDEALWLRPSRHLVPSHQIACYETMNATDAPVSAELLHTLAMQHIEQYPSQKAMVTRERTLTYAQLHRMANQVGSWLRQRGVRPNSLVAVVMEKGWEQVVATLGILYAGAAYLPIDPALPRQRLWYILKDGAVQQVLTQQRVNDRLEWPKEIQRLCIDDEHITELPVCSLAPVQHLDDLAYVIYTSGSTGTPKGVMIDHRGAVNTVLDINKRFNVGPEDRILALSSLGFDLSVYDVFGMLGAGGVIILPDADASRDPAHWAQMLNQEQVTIWNSAPALMELLIEYLVSRAERLPLSLRLVLLSGDWIPVHLPGKIKALGEDIQVVSLGGATEASIWSILYPIEMVRDDWRSIPYGRPMQNQHVYVLDANLNHRATWVPGHLYIGGIGLARGYWHDEAKTSASFIEHPHTHERLYQTGDLGRYLPDGTIEFLGREDFQVKVQGYRIELGEIEETLKQYVGISEVIASVEKTAEQGEKCLVAYVVSHDRQELDPDELRAFAKTKLPAYMVPLVIVPIDAVPLGVNGKVDRKALPKWYEARSAQQKISLAPRDALEQQLVNLWETILERHPIGVTDNFFELGGNSLGALRLMERIRKQFGQELPLSILFEGATIDQLANILRQPSIQSVHQQSPLVAIQPNGLKPPFFCIHPVGGNVLCYVELSRQLGKEQPFYALQALGLEGEAPPYTSLEEMAVCYRELIETVQPQGPYLLGGWSMGGMVAFEMAQQWYQEGKEVALLALLDSDVPQNGKDSMLLDDADLLAWFAKDLGGSSGKSITLASNDLRNLGPDEQLSFILEQAQQAQVLPLEASMKYLHRLVQVFKANAQALTSYVPLAYPHQTVLLATHETLADHASDQTLGWGKLIGNALEVFPVSGNHYTMLTQPYVQQLAERLTWCIEMERAIPR